MPDFDSPRTRRRERAIILVLAAFCLFYGFVFAFFAPVGMMLFLTPAAGIGLLVVWALPEVDDPPTRTLERLFFAVIVALGVWPNYLAIALPGLPWITVVRLAAFPMAGALLVCFSASAKFRGTLKKILSGSNAVTTLVLVFTIDEIISIVLSTNKGQSLGKFFIAQVMWTGVFLTAAYSFNKPGRALRFAKVLWGLTILICLIGLVEYKLHHVPWAGHVPHFLQIQDKSVAYAQSGKVRAGVGAYRVQSIFSHPNTLAEFLALVFPFILNFAVRSFGIRVRLAATATLPLVAFVVYLTNSRIGSIGLFISVLIYGFFWAQQQLKLGKSSFLGSILFYSYPIVAAAGLAVILLVGRLRKLVFGGGGTQASTAARVVQMKMGIPKIEHNPFGYGIGRSAETLNYVDPSGLLTIDSFYLGTLLEFGVIGFVIYFATFVFAIYQSGCTILRNGAMEKEVMLLLPAMIALTNFLVIKSVFSQEDNHPIAYMLLGMIVALLYRAKATVAAPATVGSNRLGSVRALAPA